MAHGVEALNAVMGLLGPRVELWMVDPDVGVVKGGRAAKWRSDGYFDVWASCALNSRLEFELVRRGEAIGSFHVKMDHVMGACAGDTINLDDVGAELVANGVFDLIESGALKSGHEQSV